ncbi:DUF6636 domain-containing protein [Mesorhizobium sp. ZC-5]|uniref:DUF6636 domain-containing protein n=1 Tax=Mesorhizobium sp. ZC-5 TaxID=2986066 RepID=UPI0021E77AC0|nr:DUF6636 domain-containing protein [Mesorhizobium sp. ZC-5]MCV3241516.1 hypothetical protein [Mesorhizobium sp. ZC-5]
MGGVAGNRLAKQLCRGFAVAASLLFQSPLASAQDMEGFRSPTGNIQCLFFDDSSVRCMVGETANPRPARPPDCELDWGSDFGLDASSRRGERLCVGDTIAGDYEALPYGESVRRGGITCSSERTGVTCINERGAGFELSRARQRLF